MSIQTQKCVLTNFIKGTLYDGYIMHSDTSKFSYAALKNDEVRNELGYWDKSFLVRGRLVKIIIMRRTDNEFIVWNGATFKMVGTYSTLGNAVINANKYIKELFRV